MSTASAPAIQGSAPAEAPARLRARSGVWVGRIPAILAAALLGFYLVAAFVPGLLAPHDAAEVNPNSILAAPSPAHPFGTDELGRDILSRIIHAAGNSLLLGFGAVAIALVGGTVLGLSAALGHRFTNAILMRFVDIGLAFPELLLALLVIAIAGAGPTNALLAIGIATIPTYARVIRAEALSVRRSTYVEAARALGQPEWKVLVRHVLPNALRPLIVIATIGVGTATLAGAGLSFIGLGVSPPTPEWGSMLATARSFLQQAWWYGAFPGLAITSLVVSTTVLGRALQARTEGRAA
ncbi:ABC transporter permease [Brevibacterium daeguense]|uniref:ABC transporter permease n=1 Tax=Brevibacterium daeguense TaxID=909936 RepID=A0ABP8EET2_9MICO|nr:ABC transporter permease [Brevibacterium daeguense]